MCLDQLWLMSWLHHGELLRMAGTESLSQVLHFSFRSRMCPLLSAASSSEKAQTWSSGHLVSFITQVMSQLDGFVKLGGLSDTTDEGLSYKVS